ncbi:MAG: hypothetical protein ACE5E4_13265 [Candidatus Binatia bacterium]
MKGILKLMLDPMVLAAGGAYLGHAKYSKKHGKYLAPAVGAGVGFMAGKLIQKQFFPNPLTQQPMMPGAPAPPVSVGPDGMPSKPPVNGVGDYFHMPGMAQADPTNYEELADQVAEEADGSLGGGFGASSLGVDADDLDEEQVFADAGYRTGPNGAN